jgi:hypothetical protein
MSKPHKKPLTAKHPSPAPVEPELEKALIAEAREGRVSCAAAHRIAEQLKTDPAHVGTAMDLLNIRINRCQMGLFGYFPEKRILKPAQSVEPSLEEALKAALKNGRLACADAWILAERFMLARPDVASACEALKIRISPCQLGAF